ncbi:hypothetical protein [Streptomyces sp. CC210A]|uniref:hypothetical protein n=1 Tax=Streptomyces sp. CC210A TaxID=2898184 RepID=UPI0035A96A84
MRSSLGIAQLALQQIEDDLSADDIDALELAAILRELQEDIDVPGGLPRSPSSSAPPPAGRSTSSPTATVSPPAPCTRPPP